MKNKIFILSSVFTASLILAQREGGPAPRIVTPVEANEHNMIRDYANNWSNNVNKSLNIDDLKKETKGTPYFDNKFYSAKIENFVAPDKLRYNAFSDQMEFMKDNVTYEINKISGLRLFFPEANRTYVVVPIQGKDTYLQELKNGNYSLYKKQTIILTGGEGVNNGMVDNSGYRFSSQQPNYYVMFNKKIYEVPKSGKELLELTKDTESLKKMDGKNKYKLSKEADITSFIDLLNNK